MECFSLHGNSPPPEVVLFDRSVRSDWNLLLHFQKFPFPVLLCEAVIKISVETQMDRFDSKHCFIRTVTFVVPCSLVSDCLVCTLLVSIFVILCKWRTFPQEASSLSSQEPKLWESQSDWVFVREWGWEEGVVAGNVDRRLYREVNSPWEGSLG